MVVLCLDLARPAGDEQAIGGTDADARKIGAGLVRRAIEADDARTDLLQKGYVGQPLADRRMVRRDHRFDDHVTLGRLARTDAEPKPALLAPGHQRCPVDTDDQPVARRARPMVEGGAAPRSAEPR